MCSAAEAGKHKRDFTGSLQNAGCIWPNTLSRVIKNKTQLDLELKGNFCPMLSVAIVQGEHKN